MKPTEIKICYFPGRESTYVRNRVLVKGMREAGLIVYDCSYPRKSFLRYIVGFFKFLYYKNKSDIVFIGFLGQSLIPIVRLFTRKKILFDAFLSMYQTLAFDRKAIHPSGITSKIVRLIERLSCQLSDLIFLDTNQHIDFFIKEYPLERNKFRRSFLGADNSIFYPKENSPDNSKKDDFIIHFHGEFQALHGTKYIIETARLLPNFKFRMIGGGRELNSCLRLVLKHNLKNIEFIPLVRFDEIPEYISKASICLGIFGETQKTQLVIPIKVYETIAMAKPLITADTPAARELLTHRENAILCKVADPENLAEAIRLLHEDSHLRDTIAKNGYDLFKEKCCPAVLGEEIKQKVQDLLKLV